ncbi:MAG: segregation/condensation protein A, partial [Anaerovorax sp.]
FDLLVYLIENAEMNIYDIQVSLITEQYLAYMGKMQEMNVVLGSEFMVLAASLIEIKSKLLLPRFQEDEDNLSEEDPRLELMNRLLEYKGFKAAAELLQLKEERNLRIFEKPQEDMAQYTNKPDEYLNLNVSQFVKAFRLFIEKNKKIKEVRQHYTRVERQKQTIESRILQIKELFFVKAKNMLNFKELLPQESKRYDVVITFVSMLEMIRLKSVNVAQKVNFGEIQISLVKDKTDKNCERGSFNDR